MLSKFRLFLGGIKCACTTARLHGPSDCKTKAYYTAKLDARTSVMVKEPSSRLLQSAVREAVGTAGLTSKATESSAKRRRSVVAATSTVDDSRRRLWSVATVASSIVGVALKAAAEAAEDVLRVRTSGNVFDRLGRGVDVVEDIVKFGKHSRFGLEAGSKPELPLAMSCLCSGGPDALLLCNGSKDVEYITLALIGRKFALNTVTVLEQAEVVDLVIELSNKFSVRPVSGLRANLRTKHSSHFGFTSSKKGKPGLTTMQILLVVRKLEQAGTLDCMQLLQFHIGSKSAESDVSFAHGLQEHASAVVRAIRDVCNRQFVGHPVICSESDRVIVSHHSILIFEAVGANNKMEILLTPSNTETAFVTCIDRLADRTTVTNTDSESCTDQNQNKSEGSNNEIRTQT